MDPSCNANPCFCPVTSIQWRVSHNSVWPYFFGPDQTVAKPGSQDTKQETGQVLMTQSKYEGSSCVWERKIDSEQIVQLPSHVQRFATPRTVVCLAPPSSIVSRSLLKFMSIESVMPSNHFIFCFPLLLLPSVFPTIRVFTSWLCK